MTNDLIPMSATFTCECIEYVRTRPFLFIHLNNFSLHPCIHLIQYAQSYIQAEPSNIQR